MIHYILGVVDLFGKRRIRGNLSDDVVIRPDKEIKSFGNKIR